LQHRARRIYCGFGYLQRTKQLVIRHGLPPYEGNRDCFEDLVADADACVADVDAWPPTSRFTSLSDFLQKEHLIFLLRFNAIMDAPHVKDSLTIAPERGMRQGLLDKGESVRNSQVNCGSLETGPP
jgi:hypothetical protein